MNVISSNIKDSILSRKLSVRASEMKQKAKRQRLVPCMIPYVEGATVGGILIVSCRHGEVGWPIPILADFTFPSAATRYPSAAGWTVSEHPNYSVSSKYQCSAQQSSALTT